jgi:hypothetical protein
MKNQATLANMLPVPKDLISSSPVVDEGPSHLHNLLNFVFVALQLKKVSVKYLNHENI